MGGDGGDRGPSEEQQRISEEQLRLEEERLALQRQAAEAERRQLELLNQQIQQQSVSNEQLLSELRTQNQAAQETTQEFGALLESALDLQQQEAALQAQEATRAESRQANVARETQTSLLSQQRDILERTEEGRRRRRAGAAAPVFTEREQTASLLQR